MSTSRVYEQGINSHYPCICGDPEGGGIDVCDPCDEARTHCSQCACFTHNPANCIQRVSGLEEFPTLREKCPCMKRVSSVEGILKYCETCLKSESFVHNYTCENCQGRDWVSTITQETLEKAMHQAGFAITYDWYYEDPIWGNVIRFRFDRGGPDGLFSHGEHLMGETEDSLIVATIAACKAFD